MRRRSCFCPEFQNIADSWDLTPVGVMGKDNDGARRKALAPSWLMRRNRGAQPSDCAPAGDSR
jgi:hypothetical protein